MHLTSDYILVRTNFKNSSMDHNETSVTSARKMQVPTLLNRVIHYGNSRLTNHGLSVAQLIDLSII